MLARKADFVDFAVAAVSDLPLICLGLLVMTNVYIYLLF